MFFVMVVDGFVDRDLDGVGLGYVDRHGLLNLDGHVPLNGVGHVFHYRVRYGLFDRDRNLSLDRNSHGLVHGNLDGVRLRYSN